MKPTRALLSTIRLLKSKTLSTVIREQNCHAYAPFDNLLTDAGSPMQYLALATDYDGTLAEDGHVDEQTLAALQRLRDSGRKLILVTGRELHELFSVFPQVAICDAVVAENGGLLYWPTQDRQETLAQPPPPEFIAEMNRLHVTPYSLGKVIFATWRPHEATVLEVIQRLGIGYQIVFNKRAVMVLPATVNKASGLSAALQRLKIAPENTVGIGDAENDHAFLDICAVSAAVQNALPALKTRYDIVTHADHGRGVSELIEQILLDDLGSLGLRLPRTKLSDPTLSVEPQPLQ